MDPQSAFQSFFRKPHSTASHTTKIELVTRLLEIPRQHNTTCSASFKDSVARPSAPSARSWQKPFMLTTIPTTNEMPALHVFEDCQAWILASEKQTAECKQQRKECQGNLKLHATSCYSLNQFWILSGDCPSITYMCGIKGQRIAFVQPPASNFPRITVY